MPCPAIDFKEKGEDAYLKRTISTMVGKGSLSHNSRQFSAKNIDPKRTYMNVEYCNENLQDVYHELFDEAVERFNAKQKRADRKIDDYYEKIRLGKQEKLFHELIVQIGNRDDCGVKTADGILAGKVLNEYMKDFQKRNPTLRVFAAHLHMDEATPHLHIDFVPYITGSKRGVDTRVSLKQALGALGFTGGSRSENEWNQWVNAEKEQLALVMERHGIEWEKKGTHEEHLSVLDYKKKQRTNEVAELDAQIEDRHSEEERLTDLIQKHVLDVMKLEEEKEHAQEEKVKVANELKAKNAELKRIASYADDIKAKAGIYSSRMEEYVPETSFMETAASYRKNKILPFILEMQKVLLSAYLAALKYMDKYDALKYRYDNLDHAHELVVEQKRELLEQNREMYNELVDYGRVKKYLGEGRGAEIVRRVRDQEKVLQIGKKRHKTYGYEL